MLINRRGMNVAWIGLVLQLALAGLTAFLWWTTTSAATLPALWLVTGPLCLWLLTLILFYCRSLAQAEAAETERLAVGDRTGIFAEGEAGARPAQNRLHWMERWLTAGTTILLSGYYVAMGVLALRVVDRLDDFPHNAPAAAFFAIGGAFIAFLLSRYATGMAKTPQWQLLRAPGSALFVTSLVLAAVAISLGLETARYTLPTSVLAYGMSGLMVLIGIELALNFILDLYRPRVPGVERRFSYDSRLLELLASPESIGPSVADALNYQFGFEVSSTWFYKLLQKALAPLLVVGVVVIWLLTSVVAVDEGEQYLRLHWGKPVEVLRPRAAPHFVWPWPVDATLKFETGELHRVDLGLGGHRQEQFIVKDGKNISIYLWSEEHGARTEQDILVAVPSNLRRQQAKTPSVNIIKLAFALYYQIDDPLKFVTTVADSHRLIEDLAYREMIRFAASATLSDTRDGEGRIVARGLMGSGKEEAVDELQKRISQAIAARDLGVQVADFRLLACHPPKDAAVAYEGVIMAERKQDRLRYAAQAEANRVLATVAGEPVTALQLAAEINILQKLEDLHNLRATGGDVLAAAHEAGLRAADDIGKLNREIATERLLGRLNSGQPTVAQQLLARMKEYAALLEKVQAAPKGVDLSGEIAKVRQTAETLFTGIQGDAAVIVAFARAQRWRTEFQERARAESFEADLLAARAAPRLYRLDKYLDVLGEGLRGKKKYVLGFDRDQINIWLNLEQGGAGAGELPVPGAK